MSKILIEGCAVGRPAITTNVAGCREIINHGINGYLCEPKNSFSLYLAIKKFIELPIENKLNFCIKSNQIANEFYSDKIINNKYLEIVNL